MTAPDAGPTLSYDTAVPPTMADTRRPIHWLSITIIVGCFVVGFTRPLGCDGTV